MNAFTLPIRRPALGAEELLELGQVQRAPAPTVPAPAAAPRTVALSRDEGQLLVHVVENIVAFAKSFPIEFVSYCPTDRWQTTLTQVGSWAHEIERQIKAGAQMVVVPAEMVFRLVDLEKCISAARDARLDAAKLAFTFSAVGAIADIVFGLSWIGIPAYIAGLAILFGRPLMAKLNPEPQEPYKPAIGGRRGRPALGCAPPRETEEEKRRVKYLERVVLSQRRGVRRHYWGDADCAAGGVERSVCLAKGRFRVRIEGWAGDIVVPAAGWTFSGDCGDALNVVGVWETEAGPPRTTPFGPLPMRSRHQENYWVEYVGPRTGGRIRRAGPFGCQDDTRDHALEDGGITAPGVDGDFVLFDGDGGVVEIRQEAAALVMA